MKDDHKFLVRLVFICFVVLCLSGLCGCNTMAGLFDGLATDVRLMGQSTKERHNDD